MPASQLVHWMGIGDANSAGNIHGGTVMKLADEAAGLAAIKHSRQRVVTAGMDRMTFLYHNTAYLTMVAVDEDGNPALVPALIATTPVQLRRMREAERRRANRLAERAEILAHRAQPPS